jgi:arylsulfatase A-like enzyme
MDFCLPVTSDSGYPLAIRSTSSKCNALGDSRHDPDVQDWNKLPDDERRLYARMMEVFAGFCENVDYHIGRLINFLERLGELDNTLVMVVSDNGASAEGGLHGSVNENLFFNNVPETVAEVLRPCRS